MALRVAIYFLIPPAMLLFLPHEAGKIFTWDSFSTISYSLRALRIKDNRNDDNQIKKSHINMATIRPSRTITAGDPGLLSNEELLAKSGGRRRTLEELIAKDDALLGSKSSTKEKASLLFQRAKQKTTWLLDHAQIRISVSS